MKKSRYLRQYIGLVLAVLSIGITWFLKVDGLSTQAMRTLGVLAATLFLQMFETFNLCISCLVSSVLLLMLGCVGNIGEAFSGYANHVLYFTIASFGISAAFQKSVLSRKLLGLLMRGKKLTVRKVTFTFMVCAAILSSMMSNVAAVVIFLPYLDQFLEFYRDPDVRKRSSRSMNICLVVSAMIGGIITPAGSSVNLIGLDLMQAHAGIQIRFVDWMAFGAPLAAVMLVIAFAIITAIYKPAEPEEEELQAFIRHVQNTPRATAKDIYIGVLIVATLAIWVLSSWFPAINITAVAVISFALLFIPGMEVLTWEEFSVVNSWNAFFVAGNHITLASVAISTGLCNFITTVIFGSSTGLSVIPMLMLVAAVTFVFMAIIPSAPAVATILVPILITYAASANVSPILLFMVSILCIPNIYLFPLDAPLVVAYDRKAFTMFELPKATVWIQLVMIVVASLLVYGMYQIIY